MPARNARFFVGYRGGALAALGALFTIVAVALRAPFVVELAPLLLAIGGLWTLRSGRRRQRLVRERLEASARLEAVLKLFPEGILVESDQRRLLFVNEAFCAINGIPATPSQMVGSDCSVMAENAKAAFLDPEEFVASIPAMMARRVAVKGELLRRVDGRTVERTYTPVEVDGECIGHLWHVRDVTESLDTVSRLGAQAGSLSTLFERLPVMLAMFDRRNGLESVNQELVNTLGWTPAEWRSGSALTALDADPTTTAGFRRFLTAGEDVWRIFQLRSQNGSARKTCWYSLRLPSGEAVAIGQDLTPSDRLRRELESVIENLPDALLIKEPEHLRAVRVNASFEHVFGPRTWMLGRASGELFPPEVAAAMDALDRAALDSGRLQSRRIALPSPAGERSIVVRTVPISDDAGHPILVLTLCRDVTDRERVNRELVEAKEAAQAASVAKSQFLANMSHEIRTPMNGMVGMTEVLLATQLDEEQREHVATIQAATGSLRQIIDDILDFSKIEAGRVTLEAAPFDLVAALESVARLYRPAAEEHGVALACEPAADLPPVVVGDEVRVRQIVTNLVSNAVKFTRLGRVVVRARRDAQAGQVRFEIEDTGIGIAPEVIEEIFHPFRQGDTSTTRIYGGTGLGLSICSQLVASMGGRIGVESRPSVGSTFWFVIPLPASATRLPRTSGTGPRTLAGGPSPRVLVAEDNRINQKVIVAMLRQLGCQAVVVENGRLAVEAHAREPFDLLLMDCQMPVMGGFDATAAIRHGAVRPDVPIVAMTAQSSPEDRRRCLDAGMDDYLSKPVTRDAVIEAIERALLRSSGAATHTATPTPGVDPLAPVDLTVLARLREQTFDGETDLIAELVEAFLDEVPRVCETLAAAVGAGDTEAVVRDAHRLRSSTVNLGATHMERLCRQLEEDARARTLERAEAAVVELKQELTRVDTALRAYAAENAERPALPPAVLGSAR